MPTEEKTGTGLIPFYAHHRIFQAKSVRSLRSNHQDHTAGVSKAGFLRVGRPRPRPSQSRSKSGERGTVVPSKDYSHRRSPGALLFVKGEGPDGTHTQSKKKAYEN